jgi:hypothetical protein
VETAIHILIRKWTRSTKRISIRRVCTGHNDTCRKHWDRSSDFRYYGIHYKIWFGCRSRYCHHISHDVNRWSSTVQFLGFLSDRNGLSSRLEVRVKTGRQSDGKLLRRRPFNLQNGARTRTYRWATTRVCAPVCVCVHVCLRMCVRSVARVYVHPYCMGYKQNAGVFVGQSEAHGETGFGRTRARAYHCPQSADRRKVLHRSQNRMHVRVLCIILEIIIYIFFFTPSPRARVHARYAQHPVSIRFGSLRRSRP